MFNKPKDIYCIIITLLICYLIYYILFETGINLQDQVDKFNDNGNINTGTILPIRNITPLQQRIIQRMTQKINNMKIVEIEPNDNLETIIHFKLTENNIPIGTIRYYLYPIVNDHNSHQSNHNGWLKCDGSNIDGNKYPELFKTITKLTRNPRRRETFKLPNLIGKIIRTSGTISPLSSQSPFMDYSNTGLKQYNISDSNNKASSLLTDKSIKIKKKDTLGYDYCDENNMVSLQGDNNNTAPSLCKSQSNMPPFVALIPYIKSSNINYKIKF
jgi:hypothetical protein